MLKLLKRIKENRLQCLSQQYQEFFQEINLECQVEHDFKSVNVFATSPNKKYAISAHYTVKFIFFKKRQKNLIWKIYLMKGFTQREIEIKALQFVIENQMWFPCGQCVESDDHTYLSSEKPKDMNTQELIKELKKLQTN